MEMLQRTRLGHYWTPIDTHCWLELLVFSPHICAPAATAAAAEHPPPKLLLAPYNQLMNTLTHTHSHSLPSPLTGDYVHVPYMHTRSPIHTHALATPSSFAAHPQFGFLRSLCHRHLRALPLPLNPLCPVPSQSFTPPLRNAILPSSPSFPPRTIL